MAATRTIEVKHNYEYALMTRKILGVSFIFSFTIFMLMSISLLSSYWITSDGFRQGLIYLCIEESDPLLRTTYRPLPFGLSDELQPGCYPNRDVGYIKWCTIFCLITQMSAMASVCIIGLSFNIKKSKRLLCLQISICTTAVTILCDTLLLIIYPWHFAKEIHHSNRELWELNRAYGLAFGSAVLAFGSLILLLLALRRTIIMINTVPTRV